MNLKAAITAGDDFAFGYEQVGGSSLFLRTTAAE
jgi:hypothetical protein